MIIDANKKWPANQRTWLHLTVTLPAGRTFADWDSFVLTIREDPLWREGRGRNAREKETADPHTEGWTVTDAITGSVSTSTVLLFDIDATPTHAGENRYVFDVRGVGGIAGGTSTGETELYPTTWLTITPATK